MLTWNQYLLGKLAEEAAEIAQIALKAQQFGLDDVWEKVAPLTVRDRLCGELDDLLAVAAMLNQDAGLQFVSDPARKMAKAAKVRRYAALSVELGQLVSVEARKAPANEFRDLVLARTGLAYSELECPRERSSMTPCVARDGDMAATENGHCVGCGAMVSDLLDAERAKAAPLADPAGPQPAPFYLCPTPGCQHTIPAAEFVPDPDLLCPRCLVARVASFLPVPF